jgi:exonuclease SbcC
LKDVNAKLIEILGVNFSQYSQIAMIAQGQFRELLLAKTDDRKKIFRSIFKTYGYEALQKRLQEDASALYGDVQNKRRSAVQYVDGAVCLEEGEHAAELKAAKAELKSEQQLTKEMESSLKGATKMAASMKKLYSKEEGELKSMQKVVTGQQKMLTKQKELNDETREAYTAFLDKQQKELGYALRELAERQRAVSDLETTIANHQTKLQTYNQEVVQKATALANIEAELKARVASVKAEQKAAKSMQ